jgi:hypothetical protein
MPVKESNFTHLRVNKKRASKLRKIAKKMHRSLTTEAGLAIDQYKPKAVVFRDDGR